MDIHAILRLARAGKSNRHIADNLKMDRRTVGKYKRFFKEQNLLSGDLPDLETLEALLAAHFPQKRKGRRSSLTAWEGEIKQLLEKGLKPRLIYQRLCADPTFEGSESAVYRYVRQLRPTPVQATIRVETAPGAEAQVDFGKVGPLWDKAREQLRPGWVFAMVLSWSRHMYVEFVFDQQVNTWLACHRRAFEYFGGVPARVKIDNLKAAITKACFDDPQVQRAYAECAEHYGFRIDPCRPAKPHHKGKVERGGISYIKSSLVPLLPEGCSRQQANKQAWTWLQETAGQRKHGTTQVAPLTRFALEADHLLPLPPEPYEPSLWKRTKLHRDCHVVFEKSYYSAPFRLVGQRLHLRVMPTKVELYDTNFQLVATHTRAAQPGERHTLTDHLPPEKVAGLRHSRTELLTQAQTVGPQTTKVVQRLLSERPLERSGMVNRILQLTQKYGPKRLEAACARALYFDDYRYGTIKRILQRGLDQHEVPQFPTSDGGTLAFARSQEDFVAAFLSLADGGVS